MTGTVCGLGALAGHQLAGGEVSMVPGVLALACTVLGGAALARPDRSAPVRVALLAVGGQVMCHGIFLMSPQAGAHDHTAPATVTGGGDLAAMLLVHGAVALVTIGLALGADRAVRDLARSLVAWLLPALPRTVDLPYLRRPAPAGRAAGAPTAVERSTEPARGPPRAPRLHLLLPA